MEKSSRLYFYHTAGVIVDAVPIVLKKVCFTEIEEYLPKWKEEPDWKEKNRILFQKIESDRKRDQIKNVKQSKFKWQENRMENNKDWDISDLLYFLRLNLFQARMKSKDLQQHLDAIKNIRNLVFHPASSKSITDYEKVKELTSHCKAICEAYKIIGDIFKEYNEKCQEILKEKDFSRIEEAFDKHLKEYNSHLLLTYKEMRPVKEDSNLEYVQLTIVQENPNKKASQNPELDALLETMRKANCEWLGSHDTQTVPLDKILAKDEHRVKLIIGAPGIGKSTLLRRLIKFQDINFDLVLLLPLREKCISAAKNLPELLDAVYHGNDTVFDSRSLSNLLHKNHGNSVMFLLDGFDEAVHLLKEKDSCLYQLLHGELLPKATIVITSRPGSCSPLSKFPLKCFRILGFTEKSQVADFVGSFFQQDTASFGKFFRELSSRPDLSAAAYIPVNLFILCSIFEQENQTFPSTITACFQSFFLHIIFRHLREREGNSHLPAIASLNDLPPEAAELVRKLSKLCLDGLLSDPKILVFDEKTVGGAFEFEGPVPEDFDCMGLLNVHWEEVGDTTIRTYNLQHATLQEFLSAEKLKCLPEKEQETFWSANMNNPAVTMVFRFYCGLTGLKSEAVQKVGFSKPLPNQIFKDGSKMDYIDQSVLVQFYSLFESQNIPFTEQVVQRLSPTLGFRICLIHSSDWMVLSHCLSKCSHLQDIRYPFIYAVASDISKVCQNNPDLVRLEIGFEEFLVDDAKTLFQSTQALEMLTLNVSEVEATSLSALAEVFSLRKLKELHLWMAKPILTGGGDLLRSKVIQKEDNKALKHLSLSNTAASILEYVSESTSIEKLTFKRCRDLMTKDVAPCMSMPHLVTLQVHESDPLPVLEAICSSSSLRELKVIHPFWSEELKMEILTNACSKVQVETLQMDIVRHNWFSPQKESEMMTEARADAIANGLLLNTHVKKVTLQGVPESRQADIRKHFSEANVEIDLFISIK